MIAEAAYYIAEQRGFCTGREVEDWLLAEKQIDAALSPLCAAYRVIGGLFSRFALTAWPGPAADALGARDLTTRTAPASDGRTAEHPRRRLLML